MDILSRGYGREGNQAARVDEEGSAQEFGDEPLLMARETGMPVFVGAQRYDAGLIAEAESKAAPPASGSPPGPLPVKPGSAMVVLKPELEVGPLPPESSITKTAISDEPPSPLPYPVHLLDDGFQHRQLARNIDILLLNRHDWQDWLLPAGNLREPLDAARRADVIAIPADEPELEVALHVWGWEKPIWHVHRIMEIPPVKNPVAAFCGIARPEQFFTGLEEAGLEIASRFAFPDHFTYTRAALEEMLRNAEAAGALTLITTEKDLVRLGKMTKLISASMPLVVARLRIKIENQAKAIDWLIERLNRIPNPSRF